MKTSSSFTEVQCLLVITVLTHTQAGMMDMFQASDSWRMWTVQVQLAASRAAAHITTATADGSGKYH
jgi:hypothetical protein